MLGDRADATATATAPGTSLPDHSQLLQHNGDFLTVLRVCAENTARHAKTAPALADAYADAQRHAATAHRHLATALDIGCVSAEVI